MNVPLDLIEEAIDREALPSILKLGKGEVPENIWEVMEPDVAAAFYPQEICVFIGRAVRAGHIRAGYCNKGAGQVLDMPVDAWRTDSHFLRFVGWSFDPDNWGRTGYDLPCWTYLNSDDLGAVAVALEDWRASLPPYQGEEGDGANFLIGWPVEVGGVTDLFITPPKFPNAAQTTALGRNSAASAKGHPASMAEEDEKFVEVMRQLVVEKGKTVNAASVHVAADVCKQPNNNATPESVARRLRRHYGQHYPQ